MRHRNARATSRARMFVISAAVLGAGCGSSTTNPSNSTSLSTILAGAQALAATSTNSTSQSGTAPSPGSGPTPTASSPTDATNGGGNIVTVQSSNPFQSLFVSVGGVTTSAAKQRSIPERFAAAFGALLEAPLHAATTTVNGFLRIDLPAAVTSVPLFVAYATALPASGFTLQVQVSSAAGVGPVATVRKSVVAATAEIAGLVFATSSNGATPVPAGPVANGVVTTSIDTRTVTTDANGAFDLQTGSVGTISCMTFKITAKEGVFSATTKPFSTTKPFAFILATGQPSFPPCG